MTEIILSESEVAYILHILSKFLVNKEIRDVMHILVMHYPKEYEKEESNKLLPAQSDEKRNPILEA